DAHADMAHVDVMDGHFVPNLTIGAPVVEALSKVTQLPLDVHLMMSEPMQYIDDFARAGAAIITIHAECDSDIGATLAKIRENGVLAGLSIKPGTPVEELCEYVDDIDLVLIMSVEPGFGGQKFIAESIERISAARTLIDTANPACLLEVDGGITVENAGGVIESGADILVAGSAVFGAADMADAIGKLRG
ncbi:MAG: ribulose-phosphate 3-epimerase, partial [Clostridia bacterium]